MRGAPLLTALAILGCGEPAPPSHQIATLQEGRVARVGSFEVHAESVARIAAAQGKTPREALALAVFDALVAEEATHRLSRGRVGFAESRALAQVLLAELMRQARAEGPPTPAEIAPLAERDWLRVARPETVLLVHAVVMVPADADDAARERAADVATKIERAVQRAAELARASPRPPFDFDAPPPNDPSVAAFLEAAKAVESAGFTITPQVLPPVGADNFALLADGRQPFDADFVRGAFSLERGELKRVTSKFGIHVVMGLERIPASVLDQAELSERYAFDVYAQRVAAKVDSITDASRQAVEVAPNAAETLALIELVP